MKPVINPEYLRAYGWRFIPEHDAPAGALYMLTQAIPECWQHEEWGEAATAEEADAITQANCCRVGPYDPIHVGPAPRKPSLLTRLFSRIGQKRRGWSGPRED